MNNEATYRPLRYLSLFSGIEAASVAWHPLGWQCVAVADIEAFPSAVLKYHYPNVPNLGDVREITEMQIAALGPLDAIVFGSPCQDLSVAGKRKGLDGERSGLFFTAIRIIEWARLWNGCRFALWENVPGAFSSNERRDFAEVVAAMAGLDHVDVPAKGWGTEGAAVGTAGLVEWCVLDAQWFGVAQRRRRVFALADFGDWSNRPPILLERESLRGDSAPSRAAGQRTASSAASSIDDNGIQQIVGTLCADTHPGSCSGPDDYTGRLVPPIAFDLAQITHPANYTKVAEGLPASPLNTACQMHVAIHGLVRRLTPIECERLQGFPDNFTQVAWRGRPAANCPDRPRYKALGNSMAVPVMRWIGSGMDFAFNWFGSEQSA